jgi:hypothetical protein
MERFPFTSVPDPDSASGFGSKSLFFLQLLSRCQKTKNKVFDVFWLLRIHPAKQGFNVIGRQKNIHLVTCPFNIFKE